MHEKLPIKALDMVGAWVNFPRPKTGIMRRCPLWPETLQAVQEAVEWMRESVYAGRSVEVEIDEFDAKCRYSIREGRRSRLRTA